MLELKNGDLFESGADALVNTINCVGTMGAGLALKFKKRFPAMAKEYSKLCRKGEIKVGTVWLWRGEENLTIANFPTKDHWRYPSKIEWIESGLDNLRYRITSERLGIRSIAIPALGCGFGGLSFWDQVLPLIESKMSDLPIDVLVYTPQGQAHEMCG